MVVISAETVLESTAEIPCETHSQALTVTMNPAPRRNCDVTSFLNEVTETDVCYIYRDKRLAEHCEKDAGVFGNLTFIYIATVVARYAFCAVAVDKLTFI